MKRILITGSRSWVNAMTILTAIEEQTGDEWFDYVLVSGNCPKGADAMAEDAAMELGIDRELHPANWDTHTDECPPWHPISYPEYCRSAGFRRNREMVHLGADVCLAFIRDESPGATMTAELAEKAGIPVIIYRETST